MHGDDMRYYKITDNGYITAIGTGSGGTEITEEEYTTIYDTVLDRPSDSPFTWYRLKEDLTWEAYAVEPPAHEDAETEDILEALEGII